MMRSSVMAAGRKLHRLAQGFVVGTGGRSPVAVRLQIADQQLLRRRFIFDDQNQRAVVLPPGATSTGACAGSATARGRVKLNRLPFPNSLSIQMRPPCCSTRRFVIARPSPVPSRMPLVVAAAW